MTLKILDPMVAADEATLDALAQECDFVVTAIGD